MKSKKILLICPSFFGYQYDIKKGFEDAGFHVSLFDDRPSLNKFVKALIRISPKIVKPFSNFYFRKITNYAVRNKCSLVIVVKGESLSVEALQHMRNVLPDARFVLYFWDSMKNMPRDTKKKMDYFDAVYSFDIEDSKEYKGIIYRPLFFSNDYNFKSTRKRDIDILFVGTIHGDRYETLCKFRNYLPSYIKLHMVMYMRSSLLFWILKIFRSSYRRAKMDDFIFKPLARSEIIDLVSRSKSVIDIERNIQSGYTIRTIEMLGSCTKLFTTNPKITEADFYRKNNHCLISRECTEIDLSILALPWCNYDDEFLDRYSINGWVSDVLNENLTQNT